MPIIGFVDPPHAERKKDMELVTRDDVHTFTQGGCYDLAVVIHEMTD